MALLPVPPFDDRRWALFLQPKGRGNSMVPRSKPIGACFELIVLALAKIMAAEHVACSSVRAAGVILIFDPSAKF
jgi:hypothetical protein